MIGGTLSIPFLLCPALCIREDDPARSYILCTILFVSGIVTFLQSTFGCRLPIVQGGTFTFIGPTLTLLSLEQFRCPEDEASWTEETWQVRMRAVQGAICIASIVQLVIGYTGILGLVLQYITPLTIAPSVAMIGLSLFDTAAMNAAQHWGVSMATIVLMALFSQYLDRAWVPVPSINCKGFAKFRSPGFLCQTSIARVLPSSDCLRCSPYSSPSSSCGPSAPSSPRWWMTCQWQSGRMGQSWTCSRKQNGSGFPTLFSGGCQPCQLKESWA